MFKSIIQLLGLLMIALFSTASMCNKEDDAVPQFPSLIGKWKLTSTVIDAIKPNGEPFHYSDHSIDGNNLIWEFFDNGIMRATGSGSLESNWELKVEQATPDGLGIDKGKLTLTGNYADQVKTVLKLDALVYSIERSGGSDNIMVLIIEPKNLSDSYSEVTVTYFYVKI